MVYPYLTYCNINCASTYPTRLRCTYKAQKKIVRLMTFQVFEKLLSFVQVVRNDEYI